MNILFSTTKQWNPGDELILDGIVSFFDKRKYTSILFNRHPFLDQSKVGDNSYRANFGNNKIDYIIFAGSPEYQSEVNDHIYDLINKNDVPFSYIGIGGLPTHNRPFHKADLRICRDSFAANMTNSVCLPCPSIFGNHNLDLIPKTEKKIIGFTFQNYKDRTICSPSAKIENMCLSFIKDYNPLIICHTYIDYVAALDHGFTKVFYSSNAQDFYDVYSKLDFLISVRIHGSGWAANYGVPSITIAHDDRYETAKNFGSLIIKDTDNYDKLKLMFSTADSYALSNNIINLRKKTYEAYINLLTPVFKEIMK